MTAKGFAPGRLAAAGLVVALMALAGCGGSGRTPESGATLAGSVRLKSGVPVTGGTIRVVSTSDPNKSSSGQIKGDATYEVPNAPLGEAVVLVETDSAKIDPSAFMAKVPPDAVDRTKLPPPKKYVKIDHKYNDPARSPLRHTVAGGTTRKDFEVE